METKDMIEHLHEWHENLISEMCADDVLTCDDLCGYPGPCIVIQAADLLESQQKRIAELEASIREQEERENPKPLTPDELRQMDGEPVWIDDWFEDFHGWELSEDASDYFEGDSRTVESYGTRWAAYRSKPKE